MFTGWLIGLGVALVLAVATTALLDLDAATAAVAGFVYGIVCTTVGMAVAS